MSKFRIAVREIQKPVDLTPFEISLVSGAGGRSSDDNQESSYNDTGGVACDKNPTTCLQATPYGGVIHSDD